MKRHLFWSLTLFWLFLATIAFSDDRPGKTGIIKGTITIDGRPTSDVVVSVEGLPQENLKSQSSDSKSKRPLMDQRKRKFIPPVLAVRVGTTVDFPNNDDVWHNIYSTSEPKKFDLGLYPPGKSRSVTFDRVGMARILCNVHPHMEAYIVVKGHPYFSAADKQGNYRLNAVPLGKYRLELWHPELGTKVVPLNLVREREVLVIDVDLSRK